MTNQKATQEQWQQRSAFWDESGLSQNAWCRQNSIKPSLQIYKTFMSRGFQPIYGQCSELRNDSKTITRFTLSS